MADRCAGAHRRRLDIYGQILIEPPPGRHREPLSVVEQVGQAALGVWQDFQVLLTFVGELVVTLLRAARHPRLVRWSDAWLSAERAGVDALPIALIGFLLGLILAFQSAIPMRRFGAEIFVANLIGLSMLREMGPLITAIILAGRSGSNIGGIRETQEMLDYCEDRNITSDVEVIPIRQVNEAYERAVRGDVRYRFVIDMKTP